MPRNTFFLVLLLATIAALLVGFNLGKKYTPSTAATITVPTPTVSPTPKPQETLSYKNTYCGISLQYPSDMTVEKTATGSATFVSQTSSVVLACQKDIPGIATTEENMETIHIGSISGTLYHTALPKDGTPIDVFLITHPKNNMDILLSGMGSTFQAIIASLTFML